MVMVYTYSLNLFSDVLVPYSPDKALKPSSQPVFSLHPPSHFVIKASTHPLPKEILLNLHMLDTFNA